MAKKYEELTFTDDFMFCKVLSQDPQLCRELNRSYVIFICQFNINKEAGLHRYHFANLCREEPSIELGDEAEKIFLCADGTADDVSEKLKVFLNYIAGRRPADEFTQLLENAVKSAREHIQWRQEYMTFLEIIEQEKEKAIIEERARTEQERKRADEEKKCADAEKKRADAEEKRANDEKERADKLEAELKRLKRQ